MGVFTINVIEIEIEISYKISILLIYEISISISITFFVKTPNIVHNDYIYFLNYYNTSNDTMPTDQSLFNAMSHVTNIRCGRFTCSEVII
jgi:hypothetical protein